MNGELLGELEQRWNEIDCKCPFREWIHIMEDLRWTHVKVDGRWECVLPEEKRIEDVIA